MEAGKELLEHLAERLRSAAFSGTNHRKGEEGAGPLVERLAVVCESSGGDANASAPSTNHAGSVAA